MGCSAVKETSKHQMEPGIYKVKEYQNKRYYAIVKDESISLLSANKTKTGWIADTSVKSTIDVNTTNRTSKQSITFVTRSFDLDVITILFKYRPYTSGFPNQLNTNFNSAGFIGYRSDLYVLAYEKDPLNRYQRRMNHFGYSLGFFGGLGATQMNPFVTTNLIQYEYDGVVLTKGIAGMVGIGNLTFGAVIGIDHLMDKNRAIWIYQAKPWVGFSLGINLN